MYPCPQDGRTAIKGGFPMQTFTLSLPFLTDGLGGALAIAILVSIIVFGCIAFALCIPLIVRILRSIFGGAAYLSPLHTGHPRKSAFHMRRRGWSNDAIRSRLVTDYGMSPENADEVLRWI
jgi:hypothetical protein